MVTTTAVSSAPPTRMMILTGVVAVAVLLLTIANNHNHNNNNYDNKSNRLMVSATTTHHVLITAECTGLTNGPLSVDYKVDDIGHYLQESFPQHAVHAAVHPDDVDDDDSADTMMMIVRLDVANFSGQQYKNNNNYNQNYSKNDSKNNIENNNNVAFSYGWHGSYECSWWHRRNDDDDDGNDVDDDKQGDVDMADTAPTDLSLQQQKRPLLVHDEYYHQLWNIEFAKLLVASGSPGLDKVEECWIHVVADLLADEEDDDESLEPSSSSSSAYLSTTAVHVTLEATCSGVDFRTVPLSQKIYVGNVLQYTFNDVHDDESLEHVTFAPMGKSFFGWTGDYNCLECTRDDSLHGKWEIAFASALATSGHKDVNKAHKCKITMKAPMRWTLAVNEQHVVVVVADEEEPLRNSVAAETSTSMEAASTTATATATAPVVVMENAVHVQIAVACNGVEDFSQLPLVDLTTAGHALQDSFNIVYMAFDMRLDLFQHDRPHHPSSSSLSLLLFGRYVGLCRSCRGRNDPGLDGLAKEWEIEFARLLLQSRIEPFANVEDCLIHITPDLPTGTMISTKCGLRACAES